MKTSNYMVVEFGGLEILQSYQTFVGYCLPHSVPIVSNAFYSVTTVRHINRWLDGRECIEVDPDVLKAKALEIIGLYQGKLEQRRIDEGLKGESMPRTCWDEIV